jgi:hypothetical protein
MKRFILAFSLPLWLAGTNNALAETTLLPQPDSPVLRRWLQNPPDLLDDIENNQAFPTRLGIGIGLATSRNNDFEYQISLQDVVLAKTRFSFSADYSVGSTSASNQQWGTTTRYYLAPLGAYFNFAPQLGYRSLVIDGNAWQGIEAGGRVVLALAPRAADISIGQSWVFASEGDSIGRTLLEFGYSLSPTLRLTAAIELVNSTLRKDTNFGVKVELTSF